MDQEDQQPPAIVLSMPHLNTIFSKNSCDRSCETRNGRGPKHSLPVSLLRKKTPTTLPFLICRGYFVGVFKIALSCLVTNNCGNRKNVYSTSVSVMFLLVTVLGNDHRKHFGKLDGGLTGFGKSLFKTQNNVIMLCVH